jgi:hypothetical protein
MAGLQGARLPQVSVVSGSCFLLCGCQYSSHSRMIRTPYAEAERLYWLDNWAKSRPLYKKAELLFEAERRPSECRPCPYQPLTRRRRSDFLPRGQSAAHERTWRTPLWLAIPQVRLRCLIVKATIGLRPTSFRRHMANRSGVGGLIGETRWVTRIQGELGAAFSGWQEHRGPRDHD